MVGGVVRGRRAGRARGRQGRGGRAAARPRGTTTCAPATTTTPASAWCRPGEQKLGIYRKALRCFQEGLKRRYPNLEIVDVPYDGTALPAYFLKSPVAKGPAPTVVLFDGLDNCKEMSVLFAGVELAFRGFHTLAIDGPGQGEALRLRRLPSRYDYEVPGTAAYEYVGAAPGRRSEARRDHGLQRGRLLRAARRRVRDSAMRRASRGARTSTTTRCGRSAGRR